MDTRNLYNKKTMNNAIIDVKIQENKKICKSMIDIETYKNQLTKTDIINKYNEIIQCYENIITNLKANHD